MMVRVVIVLCLIAAGAVGGLAWRRLCMPKAGIEVMVNGNRQDSAYAQTCPNGLIRVVIIGQSSVLMDRDGRKVYYSATEFHDILGLTFAHDPNPVGVSVDNRVKIETDPQLEITENSIAYSDFMTHDRILVRF